MCGICGYAFWKRRVSMNEVLQVLLSGLERVEYRGYDSAGIAVDDTADPSETLLVRSVGNISQLRAAVEIAKTRGLLDPSKEVTEHVGIAHTRWATHGGVTQSNCHPHQSTDGSFTVVHNGIMTNFVEVKEELQGLGYDFRTNTDTEVIAVLAQHVHSTLPPSATLPEVMAAMKKRVDGAYAVLIKSTHYPNELLGYRSGSPLVIGARVQRQGVDVALLDASLEAAWDDAETEVFFVSDCNSFLERTRWATFIDDGEAAHFTHGRLRFYSVAGPDAVLVPTHHSFQQLEGSVETLSKGPYPTFMLKEVVEQRESCLSTMHHRVDFSERTVQLKELTSTHMARILASRRIMFISCGTSFHSCLAVRPLMEELVLPVTVENASDFLDRKPRITAEDTCIFVSQSGETADVLLALKHCKQGGAFLVGFNNVQGSSVDRLSDCGIQLGCGAEVGVASTKAYTSQVILLTIFVLCLCDGSADPVVQDRRAEVIQGLGQLSQKVFETINRITSPIQSLAKHLIHAPSILVLGRGYDYATALETALKVKELSYVHTEGVNSGELKHGPLALVDEVLNIVCFCSHDKYFDKSMNALYQIQARGGRPVVITNDGGDTSVLEGAREVVVVPSTVDCLQPVINAVPAQLLAYYMAVMKGNNVDCPRNLAKSVTVE
eukprot:gene10862-7528_t